MIGEDLPENAFQLLSVIQDVGERIGVKEGDSLVRITQQQIENELVRIGKDKAIDRDALGILENARLILNRQEVTETEQEKEKSTILIYNSDILKRVFMLGAWLPLFKEEISLRSLKWYRALSDSKIRQQEGFSLLRAFVQQSRS